MMVADLERANSRVATVERRNVCLIRRLESLQCLNSVQEILRAEIESLRSGNDSSDRYDYDCHSLAMIF